MLIGQFCTEEFTEWMEISRCVHNHSSKTLTIKTPTLSENVTVPAEMKYQFSLFHDGKKVLFIDKLFENAK